MARKRVIDVTSATTTLGKNQSGSLVVLDRAAGIVVTLPNAGRGLEYEFVVKTAFTGAFKVIGNDSASMRGVIAVASGGNPGYVFPGDGVTHIAVILSSAASSGGQVGTNLKLMCDNDGVWNVVGKTTTLDAISTYLTSFSTS